MNNSVIKTDFAIFRINEKEQVFDKEYLPSFAFLAEYDFQNTNDFEDESPFFIPQRNSLKYPLKDLKTLSDWLKTIKNNEHYTNKCFEITSKLIDALKKVHQKKVVFACLTPTIILVDENENIWFSEWSVGQNLKINDSLFFDTSLLNYIAPEQTNRKESIPNFQTDLYALGVILLELFTKNNPFVSNNKLDTIHKHRTFVPDLPSTTNLKMGLAMGQLILKLIEKNPETRFDSIETCAKFFVIAKQYFDDDRLIEKLDIGESKTNVFSFNQNILSIYKKQIEELATVFEETYQNKLGSICLIEGENGVQKSEIINRFFSSVESENTLAVSLSLKNDQQTPLSTFRELLKAITQFYLTRPEDELLNFRHIVVSRLGIAIDVLHEIYPKIAQIIPLRADNAQVIGFELRSQLIFALAEFIKSFVQSQKKLLIHFRGFQFTTNNTLGIIDGLFKELPLENLLFLISYETNLLDESQHKIIEKLQQNDSNLLNIKQLEILPYRLSQIKELLINAQTNPTEIAFVAEILLAKSNGLSIFLQRMIADLLDKNKIQFDEKNNFWQFEKESLLAATNFSENLEEFYKKLFLNYTAPQINVLCVAAQIGDIFPKNILEKVSGEADFNKIFNFFTENNIIKATSNANDFGFVDNEIRNYCLTLSNENIDKKTVEAYLSIYPEIEKSEYFYTFLNKILHLPDAKNYKIWIEKGFEYSLRIADFDINFLCSKKLVDMLNESDWENEQQKAFHLTVNYMNACSYNMKFDAMKATYEILNTKVKSKSQYLYLAWQYAEALLLSHEFEQSIQVSVEALKKAKIAISQTPPLLRVIYSSVRMGMLMKNKDLAFFQNLPEITQEEELYKIRLLQVMIGTAFIINPKMIPELIYRQADFSMKNGFSLNLGICLACYAFMNANYQKKYKEAKSSFELANSISKILKDSRTDDVNNFLYSAFLQPWVANFRDTSQQLLDNFQLCRQTGYINMAFYNTNFVAYHVIFGEEPIQFVKSKFTEILPYINANTPLYGNDSLIIALRLFQAIGADEEDYLTKYFKSASIDEINERVRFGIDKNNTIKQLYLYNYQFYLNFLLEKYEADRVDVIHCQKGYLTQGKGYYQLHLNYYCVSLNYVKFNRKLDNFEEKYLKNTINELYFNTKINQENYEAKAFFLDGLNDLRVNKIAEGNQKLQKALESAIRFEQLLTAGLVAKELGLLYENLTFAKQSHDYFKMAIGYFRKYGADKLADKIIAKYPQLAIKKIQSLDLGQKIDLQSFINASTTISAEIKLESLLEKMMTVLAENAGAELVYFIIPNQQGFEIIASKNKDEATITQHTQISERLIPISILHYVMRSKQAVLLEDASKNPIYRSDPYIRSNKIVSVLCLPVKKNNQTIGIIYFENNLISNAFSTENTETLNLLASQIAVSFENSQLYDNMEKKVLERTNELLIEKDKSEKLLLNILPSEVAEELKELGHSEAKLYNHVTVLFADFVGFTKLSENLSPKELIDEVDEYFKAFDMIMEEFGLEKIKTIGDAYLAVCGLPNIVENHAHQAAKASKAIMDFVESKKQEKIANNHIYFDIRIGLHSGPVIAGIVGLKKFAYDIWGDTVNTAARMEQACKPNKINLSATTFNLIKTEFSCQYRGKIEAKNKGEIDMYFLD